jgi:hypothetical protein
MAPESMVHALEHIHRLLKPDGRLIDIHPQDQPCTIEVRIGNELLGVGWLKHETEYLPYQQANEAIADVIYRGWFAIEHQGCFTYFYHAETIHALREHLTEVSTSYSVDDLVALRADELMRTIETDKEVIMKEPVSIMRLRPLSKGE